MQRPPKLRPTSPIFRAGVGPRASPKNRYWKNLSPKNPPGEGSRQTRREPKKPAKRSAFRQSFAVISLLCGKRRRQARHKPGPTCRAGRHRADALPVEDAIAPDERRDANDLARAAIERLNRMNEVPRSQEAARVAETPRTPRRRRLIAARPVPLRRFGRFLRRSWFPPGVENFDSMTGSVPAKPAVAAAADGDDPRRLTPPADIPEPRPIDLLPIPVHRRRRPRWPKSVSAAKSVFTKSSRNRTSSSGKGKRLISRVVSRLQGLRRLLPRRARGRFAQPRPRAEC